MSLFGLNMLLTVQRRAQTRTAGGSMMDTWHDLEADVPGTIQILSQREKLSLYGAVNVDAARLFMAADKPLAVQQFVKDQSTGERWRVTDIIDAAGHGHHFEAIVERVK